MARGEGLPRAAAAPQLRARRRRRRGGGGGRRGGAPFDARRGRAARQLARARFRWAAFLFRLAGQAPWRAVRLRRLLRLPGARRDGGSGRHGSGADGGDGSGSGDAVGGGCGQAGLASGHLGLDRRLSRLRRGGDRGGGGRGAGGGAGGAGRGPSHGGGAAAGGRGVGAVRGGARRCAPPSLTGQTHRANLPALVSGLAPHLHTDRRRPVACAAAEARQANPHQGLLDALHADWTHAAAAEPAARPEPPPVSKASSYSETPPSVRAARARPALAPRPASFELSVPAPCCSAAAVAERGPGSPMPRDHYEVLGLTRTATPQEVPRSGRNALPQPPLHELLQALAPLAPRRSSLCTTPGARRVRRSDPRVAPGHVQHARPARGGAQADRRAVRRLAGARPHASS